jgi:hypothetical protein
VTGLTGPTGPTGPSAVITIDTQANILASTPTLKALAWATDLEQFYIADGTNWWVLSAYFAKDLQAPDIGFTQNSNRAGYQQNYITDKQLANIIMGYSVRTDAGGLRYNPTGNVGAPTLQAYYNSVWNNITAGIALRELVGVMQHFPVSGTYWVNVWSGDSNDIGLNGRPMVQKYKISMGAYPPLCTAGGSTF